MSPCAVLCGDVVCVGGVVVVVVELLIKIDESEEER